ncbi:conserved protein of unknown function [Burkholderia multivorans]
MWSTSSPLTPTLPNSAFLRHHARHLLRHATSPDASRAMPVLRRLHAARAIPEHRLADLHAQRGRLQLKHMLALLAHELGYAGWAACNADIDARDPARLDAYRLDAGHFGDHVHQWFSSEAAARAWQREHGGYVMRYGAQAVAILARQAG